MNITFNQQISETESIIRYFHLFENIYDDYDVFKNHPLLEHFLLNEINKGNVIEIDENGNPL